MSSKNNSKTKTQGNGKNNTTYFPLTLVQSYQSVDAFGIVTDHMESVSFDSQQCSTITEVMLNHPEFTNDTDLLDYFADSDQGIYEKLLLASLN